MPQKRIEAGYSIAVTHDDCGCRIAFSVVGFDGLTKSIDDELNITCVFDTDPYPIVTLTAKAELPEGQPKQSIPTYTSEYVEIAEHELYDWVYARLYRHHSRSYTPAQLETDVFQGELCEVVATFTESFCKHVASQQSRLRSHLNGIDKLLDMFASAGANPVATDIGGFTLISFGE